MKSVYLVLAIHILISNHKGNEEDTKENIRKGKISFFLYIFLKNISKKYSLKYKNQGGKPNER